MEDLTARRTIEEWEAFLGSRIRSARLQRNVSQVRLAHLADVSEATVSNLENGAGSSLATLIKVVRALDLESWLMQLEPPKPTFSPLQVLREQQHRQRTQRRRASPVMSDGV